MRMCDEKERTTFRKQYTLECCVDSVESALAAAEGGADRLELCAALVIGGTSPSLALFEEIRKYSAVPIRVLLRPRFGDFLYSAYELEVIRREIELFRAAGAQGVVIGCLTKDGDLDMAQMEKLMEAAEGMPVTLHRAFDVCARPQQTYLQAKELGVDTILTSGQAESCLKGLPLLKQLDALAEETGGPRIMAGAGVTPEVIGQFLARTGITAYHLSAKVTLESAMRYRREGVPMGLPVMSEYSVYRTDRQIVAKAKKILLQAQENPGHGNPGMG